MNVVVILTAAAVLAAAVFLVWSVNAQLQNLAERIGRLDEVTRDVHVDQAHLQPIITPSSPGAGRYSRAGARVPRAPRKDTS